MTITKEHVKLAPELSLGGEMEQIWKLNNQVGAKYPEDGFGDVTCFISEIGKAFELYRDVLVAKNNPEKYSSKVLEKYLLTFNYETAQAFDTLIDIFKASNIDTHDILNYYQTLMKEQGIEDSHFFEENLLKTAMGYARVCNIKETIYNNPHINLRPAVLQKEVIEDNFVKAGRIIDPVYGRFITYYCWDITFWITKAINAWPHGNKDFEKYHEYMMEAWLYFFKYLDLLGHDDDSVGRIYSVYHYVNHNPTIK